MRRKVVISLICFILISILIVTNNISWFDEAVYNFIYSFESDILLDIFKAITFFANTKTIIVLSILSLLSLIWKNKNSLYIVSAIIASTIINNVIKIIIRRERPEHFRHIVETTFSFPSGHAMASMTFYGAIILFVMHSNLDKKYKYMISSVLSLLILLIGLSRIYLGVHHASDIIGGWLCSFILLNILNEIMIRRHIYESINHGSK